jgi:hypothetical protein
MSHTQPAKLSRVLPAGDGTAVPGPERPLPPPAFIQDSAGERRPGRLGGRLSDAFFDPLTPEDLDASEGRGP